MSELRQAAQAALEALAYHVEQTRPIQKTSDAIVELRAALAQPPAPTAQPAAPFLFIAMDDDRRASVTWCANEAAVREAAKRSMFWLQPGEQLSAEHANELDGCVDELLESGAMHFEGDPPLYLYRVGRVAQPVQQPGAEPFAPDWVTYRQGVADGVAQAAPAERQPLSDEQIDAIWKAHVLPGFGDRQKFYSPILYARAIEAAHNITAAPAAQKGEKL